VVERDGWVSGCMGVGCGRDMVGFVGEAAAEALES
jgi:hypothetical protein